jgi:hypothetical protein
MGIQARGRSGQCTQMQHQFTGRVYETAHGKFGILLFYSDILIKQHSSCSSSTEGTASVGALVRPHVKAPLGCQLSRHPAAGQRVVSCLRPSCSSSL